MMRTERANPRVLVLGGGYAGVLAARSVAQYARDAARVTLISGNDHFVERIRLHQAAAGQAVARRPIAELLRGTDAHFEPGWVIGLDRERCAVTVETVDGTQEMPYDYLIYALGSTIDTETVPGVREHAWALDGATAGTVLAGALREAASEGGRLVVCGGGLTGIEAATEIAEAHPRLRVTMVTRDTLGAALSERGRAYLRAAFARRGIEVREQTLVTRVDPGAVKVAGQPAMPFDLCLWAGSFRVPSLAREAGLAVNQRGQVLVDQYLRSVSHPAIFAAGDAAASAPAGTLLRMACATAMPMAAQAGENVAAALRGRPLQTFRFGYFSQNISLGRHDALIQFVHPDDTPRDRIWTGRLGAWYKELINRSTVFSFRLDPRWVGGAFRRLAPRTPGQEVIGGRPCPTEVGSVGAGQGGRLA